MEVESARSLRGLAGGVGVSLLLGVFVVFAVLPDFSARAWIFYIGWFVAWAGLVFCWLVGAESSPGGETPTGARRRRWSCRWLLEPRRVLLIALVLRLLALALPLSLSDDIYRYVWDGRVILAGMDPYELSPEDDALVPLRDELWRAVAHRDVETVYPPAAQALFALAAGFPGAPLVLRAMLLGFDLLACWLLIRLLAGLNLPPAGVILYAWNPLVILEGVGMGHIDTAGVSMLLLAIYAAWRNHRAGGSWRWSVAAGFALAASILIKLVPVVLLPLWLLTIRSKRLFVSFAVVLLAGMSPILLGVGVPPGLLRYGIAWEFNGALFEPLWRILERIGSVERLKATLAWLAGNGWPVEGFYQFVYPQFLAKLILASVLGIAISRLTISALAISGRRTEPVSGCGRQWLSWNLYVLMFALVCSATLYPWYLLWALPFAAVVGSWSVILLSVSVAFAYLPRLSGMEYFPWAWVLVWLPPAALAVWQLVRKRLGSLSAEGAS